MRVLFYKRVCHTHTCVNTVRTLPLNTTLNITYKKIRIAGNDQTHVFIQVNRDDEVIGFLGGKYLLPLSHLTPCGK